MAKLSYGAGFGFAALLAIRYLVAGLVLVPLAVASRQRGAVRVRPAAGLAVAVGYLGASACYWAALQLGSVTETAPLAYV